MQEEVTHSKASNLLWQGVDFRIPIWGVAAAMVTVVWSLISSHFAQEQLAKDVAAVQATITAGQEQARAQFGQIAAQNSLNNIDLAELRIRVTNVEAIINRTYPQASANASARAESRQR